MLSKLPCGHSSLNCKKWPAMPCLPAALWCAESLYAASARNPHRLNHCTINLHRDRAGTAIAAVHKVGSSQTEVWNTATLKVLQSMCAGVRQLFCFDTHTHISWHGIPSSPLCNITNSSTRPVCCMPKSANNATANSTTSSCGSHLQDLADYFLHQLLLGSLKLLGSGLCTHREQQQQQQGENASPKCLLPAAAAMYVVRNRSIQEGVCVTTEHQGGHQIGIHVSSDRLLWALLPCVASWVAPAQLEEVPLLVFLLLQLQELALPRAPVKQKQEGSSLCLQQRLPCTKKCQTLSHTRHVGAQR